jgi:threonine dehydrogenase-like Zn-dependent dehydrogenase
VGEALVKTAWSGVSRGTERLVFEGRVPPEEALAMRAPMQEGEFPFPVKYGYSAVGQVEDGPEDLKGRFVFALHPHQERFAASTAALAPIPEAVPPRRAILAANMETALNALWDSGAGPGDSIVIVGAGVVGLLVAYLAARLPGTEVTVVDINPERRAVAERFGATFRAPDGAPKDTDIVFHTSATADGLATAIGCAGVEGNVVEMSWYGDEAVSVPLGGAFHSRRLRLISSQVGQVSPSRRPRWSLFRRLSKAVALLADDRLDALITAEVAFSDLPDEIGGILAEGAPGLATAVRYSP